MAERRMFSKTFCSSDSFLELPLSAQALYVHLNLGADDDGMVSNPKAIMRMIGSTEDDQNHLISKGFIISFDTGILAVRDWKAHNHVQKDRYHPTKHVNEMAQLVIIEDSYVLKENHNDINAECIQTVYEMDTEVSLGEDREGKDSNIEYVVDMIQALTPKIITEEDAKAALEAAGHDVERIKEFCNSPHSHKYNIMGALIDALRKDYKAKPYSPNSRILSSRYSSNDMDELEKLLLDN